MSLSFPRTSTGGLRWGGPFADVSVFLLQYRENCLGVCQRALAGLPPGPTEHLDVFAAFAMALIRDGSAVSGHEVLPARRLATFAGLLGGHLFVRGRLMVHGTVPLVS